MLSKEVLHQSVAVIPAAINIIGEAIGIAWTAPTLLSLQNSQHFTLTPDEISWLGSLHEFGKIIGPFVGAALVDQIGRKSLLATCALTLSLTWLAICFSTSVLQICIARLVFGISIGMNDITNSIYFGENFSPKLRATFYSVTLISFYTAELVEFVIASVYSYRMVAGINASIAFLGLLSMYFCRETPQYLLMKKNTAKAKKNYMWLRGRDENTVEDAELHNMNQNVEEERIKKRSLKKLLFARANYRSLIIVSLMCLLSKATGSAAILAFVTMLFSSPMNDDDVSPYQFAILFAGIRLVVSSTLPFYVERFKRRTMIMVIFLAITLIHLCTAVLYYVHWNVSSIRNLSWLVFCTVTLYASIYTVLSPLTSLVRGELYPQSIKAFGGFLAVSLLSAVGFLTTKSFLYVQVNFGVHVNFLFFATMSLLGFAYTYFKLPETRGKTLVDIQKHLEK